MPGKFYTTDLEKFIHTNEKSPDFNNLQNEALMELARVYESRLIKIKADSYQTYTIEATVDDLEPKDLRKLNKKLAEDCNKKYGNLLSNPTNLDLNYLNSLNDIVGRQGNKKIQSGMLRTYSQTQMVLDYILEKVINKLKSQKKEVNHAEVETTLAAGIDYDDGQSALDALKAAQQELKTSVDGADENNSIGLSLSVIGSNAPKAEAKEQNYVLEKLSSKVTELRNYCANKLNGKDKDSEVKRNAIETLCGNIDSLTKSYKGGNKNAFNNFENKNYNVITEIHKMRSSGPFAFVGKYLNIIRLHIQTLTYKIGFSRDKSKTNKSSSLLFHSNLISNSGKMVNDISNTIKGLE
jgi:hypothetical protein